MRSSVLLHTKFLIPQQGVDWIPRQHLVSWINRHLDRRLILLSAPPGYGKTTLLVDFVMTCQRATTWYQLDVADNDPNVFLSSLIESLRRMRFGQPASVKPIGETSQALLNTIDANIHPQHILTVLINELSEMMEEEWVVILDDYHIIANPTIHGMVTYLLENSPPGLCLILSTRSDPPIQMARLRARGMLAELRTADLSFSNFEVRTWALQNLPGISDENIEFLYEKTEGWPAALQIIRSSLSDADPDSAERFVANLSGTHTYIFEYLAEEVFRRQSPEQQKFLLCTSILRQMDAEACSALAEVKNAQEILKQLERNNLFLSRLDEQQRWYRYHHLFREFLLEKMHREQPELLDKLEQVAGCYYEAQGELEASFEHYLQAKDYASAIRVIQLFAPEYVERGRVEVLNRYLNAIPPPYLHEQPDLVLQRGNVYHRMGQANAAAACYEEACAVFRSKKHHTGISQALTRLAELNRSQGNYSRARELAAEALEHAPLDDHANRAGALMALAKSVGFLSGMDEGRTLAEQALQQARQAGTRVPAVVRASLLQSLGQICWWHGDPQATVQYCREALQVIPDELSPIAAKAYLSMATPYLYWREFETAHHYAERGLEIAQMLHLKGLLPNAYAVLGNVLTRLGESAQGEIALRQAMELSQELGLASYERLMAAGYLAYNLCGQGRVDEARQLAEGALWSYTGNPDTYEAYVCRSVLADVALEKDQYQRAEGLYQELLEVGMRRNFRIPLSLVYFGLAYVHFATHQLKTAITYAKESLSLIEPTRAVQLYLDQGERSRTVALALFENGVQSQFLQQVLDQLPIKPTTVEVVAPTASVVTVKCLGPFRVLTAGEEVNQDRWVSTKARDLLAFFITFRGERIPADRIFDALWADKAGRGRTAFHTALTRLRNALRVGKQTTKYILVETSEYWLDSARFRVDVDDFDNALKKARSLTDELDAAHCYHQAISLYEGEYLSNLYYDWLFPERRRIEEEYLSALCVLSEFHLTQRECEAALTLLQRALNIDPFREDVHVRMMRTFAALGDRTGMIRHYKKLEQLLADELNVTPLPETQRLYEILSYQMGVDQKQ